MAMTTVLTGYSPGPFSPFQAPHDLGMQAVQAGMCVGECISPFRACCGVTAENDLWIAPFSGPRKVSSTLSRPQGVPGQLYAPRAPSRAQENCELLLLFPWKSLPWKLFPGKVGLENFPLEKLPLEKFLLEKFPVENSDAFCGRSNRSPGFLKLRIKERS